MENEYGEIRKENVENEDFYTIVKIPLLRHRGFWTTSILLPRQSNHDAVERTPSKNWAFERIFEALRCFHLSPKKELLFEIRNRCVLIRSLNPDLIVLLRKELLFLVFRPFLVEFFSSPSLRLIVCTMKHNLLLHMMTLLLKCGHSYLYSSCNALANLFGRVSILPTWL